MERLEFWVDLLEASFLIGQYNQRPLFPPWPFVTTPSIDPLKNLKIISITLCMLYFLSIDFFDTGDPYANPIKRNLNELKFISLPAICTVHVIIQLMSLRNIGAIVAEIVW